MLSLATGVVVPSWPSSTAEIKLFRKAYEHNILLAVLCSCSECMPVIYVLRRRGHHMGVVDT